MPNKQITELLTEQTTGQEATDVVWIQKAAGGAGSSRKVAWENWFKAKDNPAGHGTDILIQAGAGLGTGATGGDTTLQAGSSDDGGVGYSYGGNSYVRAGLGSYAGGYARLFGGSSLSDTNQGGGAGCNGGSGLNYGGHAFLLAGGATEIEAGSAKVYGGGCTNGVGGDVILKPGDGNLAAANIILKSYKIAQPSVTGAIWVDTAAGNVLKLKTA